MAKKVTILSLGAGIQSTALALLLDQDMLPGYAKPDAAVFADTKAEPEWVYKTVKDLSEILSYPVITTSYSDLEADTWATLRREGTKKRPAQTSESIFFDIPTYVGLDTTPHPTTRRCTETYKIAPIRKAIREAFGWPLKVDQYLGISLDEIVRVKPSRVKYITNIHPLVDQRWTRNDCQLYLSNHWQHIPVGRSSCYFCPFHSTPAWLKIAQDAPEMFERACQLDDALKQLNPPQHLSSKGGLRELALADTLQSKMTIPIPGDECSGHCFT